MKKVRLITIFEDEWLHKKDQVKQFLKATLGVFHTRVYARQCKVEQLDKMPYDFLIQNHIKGGYLLIHYMHLV